MRPIKPLLLGKCFRALISSLLLLAASPGLFAATPPANDNCSGAVVIPAAGPFPYLTTLIPDVSGATTNGDPAIFGDQFEFAQQSDYRYSVWYRFTPSQSGRYNISTGLDTQTGFDDTAIAVYTASTCAGPMTPFVSSDDAAVLRAGVAGDFNADTTYFIVVWVGAVTWNDLGSAPWALQLRVSKPAAPANNLCSAAEVLPASGPFPHLSAVIDTSLATETGDPPSTCAFAYRSVWYKFTPSTPGAYTFSTGDGTATLVDDTVMTLYRSDNGTCNSLTEVACNDDGNTVRASISHVLTAATTYYLVVWDTLLDYSPGETALQVRVGLAAPPKAVTVGVVSITSTNVVLRGNFNDNGLQGRFYFDYGTTTNYDLRTATGLIPANSEVFTNRTVTGFLTNTTYNFRAVAFSSAGTNFGTNMTFIYSATGPTISMFRLPNGNYRIRFTANPAQVYHVETSANLVSWTNLGVANHLGNGSYELTDTVSSKNALNFYRVRSP